MLASRHNSDTLGLVYVRSQLVDRSLMGPDLTENRSGRSMSQCSSGPAQVLASERDSHYGLVSLLRFSEEDHDPEVVDFVWMSVSKASAPT